MSGIPIQESETDIARVVQAVIQLMQGRSNAVGQVTLRANQSTTVVTRATHPAAVNMSKDSEVFYGALTAHAAAVQWSLWTSAKVQGGFTINHVNDANTDKLFAFEIRG